MNETAFKDCMERDLGFDPSIRLENIDTNDIIISSERKDKEVTCSEYAGPCMYFLNTEDYIVEYSDLYEIKKTYKNPVIYVISNDSLYLKNYWPFMSIQINSKNTDLLNDLRNVRDIKLEPLIDYHREIYVENFKKMMYYIVNLILSFLTFIKVVSYIFSQNIKDVQYVFLPIISIVIALSLNYTWYLVLPLIISIIFMYLVFARRKYIANK